MSSNEDLSRTLIEIQRTLSKIFKEIRKSHERFIKEQLKADPTGFTVVYAFLANYCVKGALRSNNSGIECKESGLQHYTTDIGILHAAKFEANIPSREVVLSFNDWCPTPRGDACLEVSAVAKEDKVTGTKVEGGTVALIPLGVLSWVEVKYKDKVAVRLEASYERYEWRYLPLRISFSDVEKVEFELKHNISQTVIERIGRGTHRKEQKTEAVTALEIKVM